MIKVKGAFDFYQGRGRLILAIGVIIAATAFMWRFLLNEDARHAIV